ncbi:MAG TPA: NAD(P)/FAD-dependent oxidoreductase [Mycobacteriales bacterium]|nr:NAD(P)/FAD-dependent oxidoreductase [Mycobacteriales bacterium]
MASTPARPRFAIVGAGVAGVLAAIKLREAGFDDIVVYEKADRLGGTWRDNTYPGIACDVPSHLYSYSFAPNPEWSHVFSPGAEIQRYFETVATAYDVDPLICFGEEVRSLRFDGNGWLVETDARRDRADFVIAATGVLHHPRYPDISGLDTFRGPCFHTARWDHDVRLEGARVGVIGTGSSGVQVIGAIANRVGRLVVFQRTAQWVLPAENPPISADDRARFRADVQAMQTLRAELNRGFVENFADAVVDAGSPILQRVEELCRANLEGTVADPDLRERLRPDYRAACKRLVVSPNYYESLCLPHVQVIDDPIASIEPAGVRTAGGDLHELDALVLATGFQIDRFLRPIDVTGTVGMRLDDVWSDGPVAYLSVSMPGFPNLFMLNGPNGPVGNFPLIDVAEMQCDYVLQLIDSALGRNAPVSATQEATDRFEAERIEATKRTIWVSGCRSWYLDHRGIPVAWPWPMARFREVMAAPDLRDYEYAE